MASAEKKVKEKKKEHPEMKEIKFACATCGATFVIFSTLKNDQVGIDICSGCHPVYVGSYGQTKVRGRAEKLAHRFSGNESGSEKKAKEAESTVRTKKQAKKSKSFSDL